MKLGQRIAYRQAKIILLTSFLLGGLSALFQFYLDLNHVRDSLQESIERSLQLYNPNLESAIYNLDTEQTQSIADLLVDDSLFSATSIYDDFGDKIAESREKSKTLKQSLLFDLSFAVLGLSEKIEQPIIIPSNQSRNGRLVVWLDKRFVSAGLTNRAITLALSGLIYTLLLSIILFVVFYNALSKPIQQISQWVSRLDQAADQEPMSTPYRKTDELGELVHSVEQIWQKKDDASRQVALLAYYDPLTELANRRRFIERLDAAIVDQDGGFGSVLYLDIDRFKTINDSLGHQVGDQLLMTLAQRLKGGLSESATIARFGGDEFVIMLPQLDYDEDTAAELAMDIAASITDMISVPVQIGRNLIHCSTSIGLTTFPQPQDTSSQVLRRADTALYRTKADGRNGFRFFDVSMQRQAQSRWQLEEGLHKAIERNQLELWLQPQVTNGGVISGAEVLLRWRHPERGMVSPVEFISVAEESGQISVIEEWVLEESLRLLCHWQQQGLPKTFRHLSINISPAHFMQADFIQRVLPILERYQLKGINIEFEITENLLINNFKHAKETMLHLQEQGVSFSVDDFGTGYSSLRYLNQLPINVLKIDRSFVSNITTLEDQTPIVDVILLMAKKLNLEVIAEGVETSVQKQLLDDRGCRLYQGYFYSKPLHYRDFFSQLKSHDGVIQAPQDDSNAGH
ncbi:Phytochrome-like protein cph2 [Marinomonas aquimarina]|uniref:Phytochrome-like protein cph2 n=1 Tax=Marinomonas aquimarina TaxID=295068 RepID=A0A1A8T5W6_9GAMM|nr:EAL domain-containing protein [Marinomonas aquimarina]SBS26993.1 Phytochrome-like protein cph2 [Marinomonas aquimarina]